VCLEHPSRQILDEQLGDRRLGEPARIANDDVVNVLRLARDRYLSRGQVSVGRRDSPGSRYGRRYAAISGSDRPRMTWVGRTSSTKKLWSSTISSPAGDRIA
jgi:hypothetical protein